MNVLAEVIRGGKSFTGEPIPKVDPILAVELVLGMDPIPDIPIPAQNAVVRNSLPNSNSNKKWNQNITNVYSTSLLKFGCGRPWTNLYQRTASVSLS